MKNLLISTLLVIISISFTSAYYVGETVLIENKLGTDLDWTIVNNDSVLNVLPEIKINLTSIKIFFPFDMPPNSFDIVFLEPNTREVTQVIHSGRGSSRVRTIEKEVPVIQPLFLDRNITKEIIVTKECNQSNETNNLTEPKDPKLEWYLILLGMALFILMIVLLIMISKKEKKFNTEELLDEIRTTDDNF